jgi:hypothetical protein
MSRNLHGQAVLASYRLLDKPGCAIVGVPLEAILQKRAEVLLGEDFAASFYVFVINQGLVSVLAVDFDKVSGEGGAYNGTTGVANGLKLGLLSYYTRELFSTLERDVDILAGKVVALEFLKDIRYKLVYARNGRELDLAQDRVAESIRENLLDVAGAVILRRE